MNPSHLPQITRIGVYGVVLNEDHILLIDKRKGCYQGLWDLPGGGIEFGEAPEDALKREMKEEVALSYIKAYPILFLSHLQKAEHLPDPFLFHQLGQIYLLENWKNIPDVKPEEIHAWHKIAALKLETLTPFAQQTIRHLTISRFPYGDFNH